MAEETGWGLWPVTYVSPLWRWLFAALAAATLVPPVAEAIIGGLRTLLDRLHRFAVARFPAASTSPARNIAFLAIALLSLIPFSLFRIVHTRWGDAYMLVNGISYPDPALRLTATWQAPLDVWLHAKLWQTGHALFGWADAWPAYRLLSPLAGAVFVYALLRLADSAAAFAQVVVALLADAAQRARLGAQAHAFATANYGWERIVPRLEAVYAP